MIAAPAGLSIDDSHPGLAWQAALAKNDGGKGGGGGNGRGSGGGHGAGKAHGRGHGSGHGGPGSDTTTFDSVDEFRDTVRNGNAFGHGRHDRA